MDDDQGLDAPRAQHELSAETDAAALHQRAKQVFLALIDCPDAERAILLERFCEGNAELREEVATLLIHHRQDTLIAVSSQAAASQDGAAPPGRVLSPIGRQIGGIRVERELGKGGMSMVYLGHDAHLGRCVALKALRNRSGLEKDKETRSRFLREARVLSRLKHASICEIYGYEETPDGDYLILEYIDGRSLRDVRSAELPVRERDRIAAAIADALQVAHAAGVVHRDLKPENVMLTKDGQVKVLDFGIARMAGWDEPEEDATPELASAQPAGASRDLTATDTGKLTRNGRILGTTHYMSPEQARGEPISPASDIFSLGLLLYELYLGRSVHPVDLPLPLLLDRVQRGVIAPIEGLSRNRKRLLQRMLSADAASRPTVTEVAQALRHLRDRRSRLLARGVVAAVVVLVILIGAKYVLVVTNAWAQAEAARSQLDALADTLIDDMFNRLSIRDRRSMLDRLGRLPLIILVDLPDGLLRESVYRFAQRVGTVGRMRLSMGDTAGAQSAFMRMLWLDELVVSETDDTILRRKLTDELARFASSDEGCVDPRSALSTYERASAFYAQQLAGGQDIARWQFRLAMISMVLGQTYLQSGNLAAARASAQRAHSLFGTLQRKSAGARQRVFRYLSAELLRFLAETEYYAANLDAALDAAHDSIRDYEVLMQEVPHLLDMKAHLGESYLLLGRILHAKGEVAAAATALEQSHTRFASLHERDPGHSRWLTLLALNQVMVARVSRQRGEAEAAQRALAAADALTAGVTIDSLLIAQDARAQALLERTAVASARPLVEHLIALGWQHDLTHRDFVKLAAQQELLPPSRVP